MKKRIKTPAFPQWILKKIQDFNNKYDVAEDLRESYIKTVQDKGKLKAYLWYWHQALFTLVGYLIFKACWGIIMFKNYLIIALRNIKKHKVYSFINMASLVVGTASFILIIAISGSKFFATSSSFIAPSISCILYSLRALLKWTFALSFMEKTGKEAKTSNKQKNPAMFFISLLYSINAVRGK